MGIGFGQVSLRQQVQTPLTVFAPSWPHLNSHLPRAQEGNYHLCKPFWKATACHTKYFGRFPYSALSYNIVTIKISKATPQNKYFSRFQNIFRFLVKNHCYFRFAMISPGFPGRVGTLSVAETRRSSFLLSTHPTLGRPTIPHLRFVPIRPRIIGLVGAASAPFFLGGILKSAFKGGSLTECGWLKTTKNVMKQLKLACNCTF